MEEHVSLNQHVTRENEPSLDPWTPPTVTKLLFLSFRHSQGSPEIQHWLFNYVRFREGQQVIPRSWISPVKSSLRTAIGNYLHLTHTDSVAPHHKKISGKLVTFEINRSFHALTAALSEEEQDCLIGHDEMIATITTDIVFRELSYFCRSTGRPRGKEISDHETIHADPFFSYIKHYAIEQHPTGLAVFDAMYRDMSHYIQHSRDARHIPASDKAPWLLGDKFLTRLDNSLLDVHSLEE